MTASELLADLRVRGATVRVDGNDLVVRAPQGVLSAEVRAALALLKPAVMAELRKVEARVPDNIDRLTKTPVVASPPQRPGPLPPVHDALDACVTPVAPCMVCGRVRWRVWCHDETRVWQWICDGCRPLVVINPDGTRRRA